MGATLHQLNGRGDAGSTFALDYTAWLPIAAEKSAHTVFQIPVAARL
jgi:hypothetical protein